MEKSKKFIPYGRQLISKGDIEAITRVLTSDFLTQGPEVGLFEEEIAHYVGSQYCTVANSATSALHLACKALDVAANDEVWTSPISYVATANAILYCGATVRFIDIDKDDFNISIDCLKDELINAENNNKLPKALIVVHMCGQSANMEEIHSLSKKYGFKIIEDASHAIGANYQNHKVGSCKFSDLCIFSFHPVKIITTGEGGAITTNNSKLHSKIKQLVSHGVTRDENEFENINDGPWYYEQQDLGFNYRMTDFQAALGRSQLMELDGFVKKRNLIAKTYFNLLTDTQIDLPIIKKDCYSAFHLYVIRVKKEHKQLRKEVFLKLQDNGIGVNVHYIPIYRQPYFQKIIKSRLTLPNAEDYYARAISIPIFPNLQERDQRFIVEVLKDSLDDIKL